MDFNFSPEDEAFRRDFRAWLAENLQYSVPAAETLADEVEGDWEARVRWHQRLHQGGWMGIHWPKEYGGRGATILQNVIYQDELERAGAALPFTGFGISLLGPTLIHWGNDEQKRRHLPKILAGEEFWCQGYSEPIRDRTSRRYKRARSRMAITSWSMDRKSGPRGPSCGLDFPFGADRS